MVFLYVYVCDDLIYEVRDRNMIVVFELGSINRNWWYNLIIVMIVLNGINKGIREFLYLNNVLN